MELRRRQERQQTATGRSLMDVLKGAVGVAREIRDSVRWFQMQRLANNLLDLSMSAEYHTAVEFDANSGQSHVQVERWGRDDVKAKISHAHGPDTDESVEITLGWDENSGSLSDVRATKTWYVDGEARVAGIFGGGFLAPEFTGTPNSLDERIVSENLRAIRDHVVRRQERTASVESQRTQRNAFLG